MCLCQRLVAPARIGLLSPKLTHVGIADGVQGGNFQQRGDASTKEERMSYMSRLFGAASTYKIPMLIAISAPSFSLLEIIAVQMIRHGSKARMMSMVPEYTLQLKISTKLEGMFPREDAAALTGHESIVIPDHESWPACTCPGLPEPLHRPALDPLNRRIRAYDHIHGYDDEPDEEIYPTL